MLNFAGWIEDFSLFAQNRLAQRALVLEKLVEHTQ